MENEKLLNQIFDQSIKAVIGWEKEKSLGGLKLPRESTVPLEQHIINFFSLLVDPSNAKKEHSNQKLADQLPSLRQSFVNYYKQKPLSELTTIESNLCGNSTTEEKAKAVTSLFLPEILETDSEIVEKWKLKNVTPNPQPIQSTEVLLQLNALYTFPQTIDNDLPSSLKEKWEILKKNQDPKLADYDHPVPLFEKDEDHELINCLKELDGEIAFEKTQGIIPPDYLFPVLISVSVTHQHLDLLCGDWLEWLLKKYHFKNLKCFVLTENKIELIKSSLLKKDFEIYTVLGKYATHFNALKYSQLLFEKAYHLRAGFKLDTDEGIRSKDLYTATGKTWLQTMCHDLWGGKGENSRGESYYLGVNEGEYVNKKDIDALGFAGALRTPDVNIPSSYCGSEIFFNKAFAHGRCTALYNQFNTLEEHISHPVVKGGGYGITNDGLRKAVPFTLSKVGRAEDQQFYFCSLAGGCRGIFNPDLRIAHYKSSGGAVAQAEEKTIATRFIGDMYRLIIFSHIVELLPEMYQHKNKHSLKREIDPMPGVFAGKMSTLQAFLNLHYKAYHFCTQGKQHLAQTLLTDGINELLQLINEIENGTIKQALFKESKTWKEFIQTVEELNEPDVRKTLDTFAI